MKYTVKIIIATHKKYQMPQDQLYIPLHVGAEGKIDTCGNVLDFGYLKDNTGDNISELNFSFCELTGLYWARKNLDFDYIGLAHYRRHFSLKNKRGYNNILTYKELEPFLGKIEIFLPQKRRYYIETLYSHYKHTHYAGQLDETRKIIAEKYPEYLECYDEVLKHTYGYMFNMMIMSKNLLNDYCEWLFNILFELNKRVDTLELDDFQKRFPGRISEIIFNVWIAQKIRSGQVKKEQIMEIPCVHMENINWVKKGSAFLKAKFLSRKYNGSF